MTLQAWPFDRDDDARLLTHIVTLKEAQLSALPIVPLTDEYWRARGPFLAQLYQDHGPVVRAILGHTDVVFLLGAAANRIVLQTHRHSFAHHDAWDWVFGHRSEPPNLITMDDPPHAWHRQVLHPAFAARRVDAYLPLIVRAIDRRLATWATRGVVDIYEEARVIALDVVAEALLGLQTPAERSLCRAIFLHGAHQRAGEFAALIHDAIAARRMRSSSDVLGLLARARDERGCPFDEAQILAHAEVVLIAGHETTASLAAWALYLLVVHPDYATRILDELDRAAAGAEINVDALRGLGTLDHAVSEAERLYPPVSISPRIAIEPVPISGHIIPAGTRVFYSAAATHLMPELWADPARFDPDRFAAPREEHKRAAYGLVGFGGGPRVCIGRTVARVELANFLVRVLRRFRLTLVSGQTIIQRSGVTSRPLHGIRVHVQPH